MRAVIAALAPSPRSLPALKPILQTWEDHLWARVEMLSHSRIADSLDALGGYWEANGSANRTALASSGQDQSMDTGSLPSEQDWCDEVANALAELQTQRVVSG